jgi:hypothetical protein
MDTGSVPSVAGLIRGTPEGGRAVFPDDISMARRDPNSLLWKAVPWLIVMFAVVGL